MERLSAGMVSCEMKMMIYGRNPSRSLFHFQSGKLVLPKEIRKGLCVRNKGLKLEKYFLGFIAQLLLFYYLIEFSDIFQSVTRPEISMWVDLGEIRWRSILFSFLSYFETVTC